MTKYFDPASYLPAHAMLTNYYSTNDVHVMQNYTSMLSSQRINHIRSAGVMCTAVQGGKDPICPPDTALDLHQVWEEMELKLCLGSGHSMYDAVVAGETVKAMDAMAERLLSSSSGSLEE